MKENIVVEFEQTFAAKLGVPYAIAVNSGTSALHSALVAIDVRGKEVVVPALTPAMVAFAVIHAGGVPVFADVDRMTHLVTRKTIAEKVTENTRAIIAVALHGLPVDIDPILETFSDLYVIEDCAQALLARYKDKYAGTKAHIGCFSFEKKKHLTSGSEGGMIVGHDPDLMTRARKFSGIGYKHMTADAGRTSLSASVYQRPDYTRFDTIGLNYRMSEQQAAAGHFAMNYIDDKIATRQAIGLMWQQACNTQFQPHEYDADNSFYSAAYVFHGKDWIGFYNEFVRRGGDGFYAMPQCPYNEPALKEPHTVFRDKCPNAEYLQRHLMCLKTHYVSMAMVKMQTQIMGEMIAENYGGIGKIQA